MVRIYPGAMSQVVDGLDGMLRMPYGCFEQTSSSAYPNILIVDYIKKNRVASPAMLMKAEQLPQRRLSTAARPSNAPAAASIGGAARTRSIWTSAYGLQEFNDMAKVYPIDRGIIDRTQGFLHAQTRQGRHLVQHRRHARRNHRQHGQPEAAADQLRHLVAARERLRQERSSRCRSITSATTSTDAGENGYILALAANALAAYDAKDDSTLQVCQQLDKLRAEEPQLKVQFFPARGTQLDLWPRR